MKYNDPLENIEKMALYRWDDHLPNEREIREKTFDK